MDVEKKESGSKKNDKDEWARELFDEKGKYHDKFLEFLECLSRKEKKRDIKEYWYIATVGIAVLGIILLLWLFSTQ